MSKQPTTTSTNEPQTAEYQAAVDNVWFENTRNARGLQSTWNLNNEIMWDRWDYVSNLEEKIDMALGR